MKFYVHAGESNKSVTFVFQVLSSRTTLADIIQVCQKELSARSPNESFSNIGLIRMKRKQPLPGSHCVTDILVENEDLFLISGSSDVLQPKVCVSSKSSEHSLRESQHCTDEKKKDREGLTKEDVLRRGQDFEASGDRRKAVQLYIDWLQRGSTDVDIWNRIIRIYLKAGRFVKALQKVEEGLKQHPNHETLNMCYLKSLVAVDPKKALAAIVNYSKKLRGSAEATKELKHELQLLLCHAYQKLNKTDMAIVLVEGVLRQNKNHQGALLEYAKLTFDLGEEHAIQSVTILLNGLVKEKDNKTVKLYLTEICKKCRGLEYLERVSGDAWSSIPALVFLSSVFRDYGALELSMQLLQRAVHISPASPDAVLNYIHLLEIMNKSDEAIKQAKAFFSSSCSCAVFQQTHCYISDLLSGLPDHIYLSAVDDNSVRVPQMSALPGAFTSDDLTTLAVWFTVVKILYVQGSLAILPELCHFLDPYSDSRELHKTEIRNEAAYFNCIKKVILEWSRIPKLDAHQQFIYVIGDSHCITAGWQSITYKNELFFTHPVLSTGTKIWHLRPDSVFYPKATFHNAISLVPDNAMVIIILGEIDCREALVQCVEKCIYDDLQEAVDHVINIYTDLLIELEKKYKWKIFVHPVPPVLDITRHIVTNFNNSLMVAINKLKSSKIFYLDGINEQILTSDGRRVKDQYGFDDTHLHPRYVELLERSLQQF